MFFHNNSTTELIYGALGALIFSAYILVDTQLIMRHYHVEEEIAAAISLYLDVINLFLMILRILNSQRDNWTPQQKAVDTGQTICATKITTTGLSRWLGTKSHQHSFGAVG